MSWVFDTSILQFLKYLVDDSNSNVNGVCKFKAMKKKIHVCRLTKNNFYPKQLLTFTLALLRWDGINIMCGGP